MIMREIRCPKCPNIFNCSNVTITRKFNNFEKRNYTHLKKILESKKKMDVKVNNDFNKFLDFYSI